MFRGVGVTIVVISVSSFYFCLSAFLGRAFACFFTEEDALDASGYAADGGWREG